MAYNTMRLPRLLEPNLTQWNVDPGEVVPIVNTIDIELPVTPESLQGRSKDYVMYAAYYIRKECPDHLNVKDVVTEVHRRVEYMDYMITAAIRNPVLGQFNIAVRVEEMNSPESDAAHSMIFEKLERAYTDRRHEILKEAVQRGQAND